MPTLDRPRGEATTEAGIDPAEPTVVPVVAGRTELLLVVTCLVVGAVLRFVPGSPMWLDEALTTNIAGGPLGDITGRLRHDGHPPLFYWLLHGWMRVFGDSAAAARSLSGVFGLVALVLVWQVGRRHGGPVLGLMAAAVLAVSPYGIRYSSEVRMYELVVVLVLAGWLLLDRAIAEPRLSRLAPLTLVSGALLLTHYWAMFLLAALGIGLVVHAVRAADAETRRALLRIIVAIALGAVFFLPWLSAFRYQAQHTGTPWAPRSRPTRVASESLADWTGGSFPESTLLLVVLAPLAVLGLFGRRVDGVVTLVRPTMGWRLRAALLLAGTAAIGAVVTFVSDGAFAGRYASVYFPLFVVLIAAGLVPLGPGWVRVGALALVAVFGVGATGISVLRYDRTQAGQVAQALNQDAQAGDLVVVCPDQLGPSLMRLVKVPGLRVVRYPDLGDPHFVDWVDYTKRLDAVSTTDVATKVLAEAGNNAIWVEWNDGYQTVGPQCGEFVAKLVAARPAATTVVTADNVKYFEYTSLIRLAPRS